MIKISTWNILHPKNIYYNLKCSKQDNSDNDNKIRYDVIQKILMSNDFDICALQEIDIKIFSLTNSYNEMINRYNISYYNDLAICYLKNKFHILNVRENVKLNNSYGISASIGLQKIILTEIHSNRQIVVVNLHLLSTSDHHNIANYINELFIKNPHIVVLGDLNIPTSFNIFENVNNFFQKINISNEITSYHAGICDNNNNFIAKERPYTSVDHIYIKGFIEKEHKIFNDFDDNFKLFASDNFKKNGPPFCFSKDKNITKCELFNNYTTVYLNQDYKWPSDHAILEAMIEFTNPQNVENVENVENMDIVKFKTLSKDLAENKIPKMKENIDNEEKKLKKEEEKLINTTSTVDKNQIQNEINRIKENIRKFSSILKQRISLKNETDKKIINLQKSSLRDQTNYYGGKYYDMYHTNKKKYLIQLQNNNNY